MKELVRNKLFPHVVQWNELRRDLSLCLPLEQTNAGATAYR